MATVDADKEMQTLTVHRVVAVAAPPGLTFRALLEEVGPANAGPDGVPLPMVLEPWPGGRWFRDLGDGAGHLWGHVQVIKPPGLLEVSGPMFMSYPAFNHVQYRLTPDGDGTRLEFTHRAFGLIPPEIPGRVGQGWDGLLERVRASAERARTA